MKIPIFPGKYHQNGGFSMAMLVYRRVAIYTIHGSYGNVYVDNLLHQGSTHHPGEANPGADPPGKKAVKKSTPLRLIRV